MSRSGARKSETFGSLPPVTLDRCILIEELRLLYVPVPKAACTSLRWLLADLAGIPAESFEDTTRFRITRGQTIQNIHKWPSRYVIRDGDPGRLEEAARAEGWFLFSVVRDPARRLWSAWQSKLLLRQPGFVGAFGEEPWFPGVPSSPEEVIEGYERFVAALGTQDEDRRPSDPHWRPQAELLGDATPALDHVGRTEAMGETLELLGEHVARFGAELPPMRRENLTPLPYPEGLLSDETLRIVREYYADDYRAFGYAEPNAATASEERAREWKERTDILLDSVGMLIGRNERLATLNRSLQEARGRATEARKNLRQEVGKRDQEIVRLHGKIEALEQRLRAERESLREIQESSTWRYTAPLRGLVDGAKHVKRRG